MADWAGNRVGLTVISPGPTVANGPDLLAANGLPFVVKAFRSDQRIASRDALDRLSTGKPAPLQRGIAARDVTEVSPLDVGMMTYSVGQ